MKLRREVLGIALRFLISIRLDGQSQGDDAHAERFFYTVRMYARKVHVEYEENGARVAAPLKWLDSFSMRSFTNDQVFDDTLPVADGVIEVGTRVPLELLRERMEDWFRRKSYLPKDATLIVSE